jgi:bisphosphoglycerate-dependent phosphoglycerate mutase
VLSALALQVDGVHDAAADVVQLPGLRRHAHRPRHRGRWRSWVPVRRSWRLNSNHYGAPCGESLHDVTLRLLPYWSDVVVPDLGQHRCVPVVSHGNTLAQPAADVFCPVRTARQLYD